MTDAAYDPLAPPVIEDAAVDAADKQLDKLILERQAWVSMTATKDGRGAIETLGKFCGQGDSPLRNSVENTMVAIGRLEVWLFVQERLNLTDAEAFNLVRGLPE